MNIKNWWDDVKDFFDSELLQTLIALVVLICIGLLLIFMPSYYFMKASCAASTRDLGLRHDWSFLGGCRVELNGHLIPLENVRWNQLGQPMENAK